MLAKNMESVAQCLDAFFDPRKSKTRSSVSVSVKHKYILFSLQEHWDDICGLDLAKNCYPEKIIKNELFIVTKSAMLASELYMMHHFFLKKVNDFLAERITLKKLNFHVGGNIPEQQHEELSKARIFDATPWKDRLVKKCPQCGALITAEEECCVVCSRKLKEELENKLAALLKIEPWLNYEQSCSYYYSDPITFQRVKSRLSNYYFEKIRAQNYNSSEAFIAVMLLTGKPPEELDDTQVNNVLTRLRRNSYVSTSRR